MGVLASTSHQLSVVTRLANVALPGRVYVGCTAAEPVRRLPSGVECLDALLAGGLPRGRLSELTGASSSGKTSLLLTLLAATTRRGEIAACVDLADALSPESVMKAGVDVQRFLWVRPPAVIEAMRCTDLLLQAGGFALIALDLGAALPRPLRSHIWPRLARAAEQSHTALVILAAHRVAGSCAALSLSLRSCVPRWQRGLWPLFEGFHITALVERNKLGAAAAKSVKLKAKNPSSGFQLSTFDF